jgi:hypothetical protein
MEMGQPIPRLELEVIVMANVTNPEFKPLMLKLTLEMGQTEGQTYDYLEFLKDCRTLAAAKQSADICAGLSAGNVVGRQIENKTKLFQNITLGFITLSGPILKVPSCWCMLYT